MPRRSGIHHHAMAAVASSAGEYMRKARRSSIAHDSPRTTRRDFSRAPLLKNPDARAIAESQKTYASLSQGRLERGVTSLRWKGRAWPRSTHAHGSDGGFQYHRHYEVGVVTLDHLLGVAVAFELPGQAVRWLMRTPWRRKRMLTWPAARLHNVEGIKKARFGAALPAAALRVRVSMTLEAADSGADMNTQAVAFSGVTAGHTSSCLLPRRLPQVEKRHLLEPL